MQRTIKIKLNPNQKKKDEILSTMKVYREIVKEVKVRFPPNPKGIGYPANTFYEQI